jgi:hypothetical protein
MGWSIIILSIIDFWLFMNTRLVLCLVFCWIINCPCLSFLFVCVKLFCVLFMCYNQYKFIIDREKCKNRINVTLKPMPKIFGTCVCQIIKV